jgi:hypothetical protein
LSATAAAIPTPPPLSPDSPLALLLPWVVLSPPFGSDPSVWPLVLGLLLVWSLVWSSAFLPPPPLSCSPAELASDFASLDASVDALTVRAPPVVVRLRSTSATVLVSMTLIATAAPIAASLPGSS